MTVLGLSHMPILIKSPFVRMLHGVYFSAASEGAPGRDVGYTCAGRTPDARLEAPQARSRSTGEPPDVTSVTSVTCSRSIGEPPEPVRAQARAAIRTL